MHVDDHVQKRPYTHASYYERQKSNRFRPRAVYTDKFLNGQIVYLCNPLTRNQILLYMFTRFKRNAYFKVYLMSRKLKSCHTLVQAFICCASIVLTKMNKWSIPYCNIEVLACRCNEGYCMFWFTETTKDESSKNWKTSLVFIVLAFDKTTTLPTHAKDQSGYLEFILDSEGWCEKV